MVALVYFAWDNFAPAPSGQSSPTETTQQAAAVEFAPKPIAVLPFADLSQDQEWFADGLAEEILNVLVKTPDLLVSSRTSSFRYKDSTLDLPVIARELGVAHILEGSVRSSGNRASLLLSIQLSVIDLDHDQRHYPPTLPAMITASFTGHRFRKNSTIGPTIGHARRGN